jgi:hypothetical protein
MIRLSPGILASSHSLLKLMVEHEDLNIIERVQRQASIDGTKTDDVIDTAKACGWIEVIDEIAVLSASGIKYASSFDRDTKRLMISDYISNSLDSWRILIPRGRKECSSYLPADVLSCFNAADLLSTPATDEAVLWWDQQAQIIRSAQVLSNLDIGRIGEKHTLAYEIKRTGCNPIWKSVESNLAGYDVLSVTSHKNKSSLLIEVKTSNKPVETARAFITRHEWETSRTAVHYVFHFWSLCDDSKKFATITTSEIEMHVPADAGSGRWEGVEVPYKAFEHNFESIER